MEGAVRRVLLAGSMASALVAWPLAPAWAQSSGVQCVVTTQAPLLRAEAVAELIGDIRLSCTGGDPNAVYFLGLELILNTNITSNPTGEDPGELEALLLIDDPLPGTMNVSNQVHYFGQVKGTPGVAPGPPGGPGAPGSGNVYTARAVPGFPNRIQWLGIPFVPAPPGEARILRIVNVRADMTLIPSSQAEPGIVRAILAAIPPNLFMIAGTEAIAGRVLPSLAASLEPSDTGVVVELREQFPTAFRKRIENSPASATSAALQAIPEVAYFTESGFTPEFSGLGPGAIGVASTGTRFVIQFEGLPGAVFVAAPGSVTSQDLENNPGALELRRVVGHGEDYSGGWLAEATEPEQLILAADGKATIVYEVVARSPYQGVHGGWSWERFRLPIRIVRPQPVPLGGATLRVAYGPQHPATMASRVAPEPRFLPEARPAFVFALPVRPSLDYLTFEYAPGDSLPLERRLRFEAGAEAVLAETRVIPEVARGWLHVGPAEGHASGGLATELVVSVEPASLSPGQYSGAVITRLNDPGQTLRIVPVLLEVLAAPELVVDTAPVRFSVVAGAAEVEPVVRYVNARHRSVPFEIAVSTSSGGSWLSATASWNWTPANLSIVVHPAGLAPGRYAGQVRLSSPVATNSPRLIPVELEVLPAGPYFTAAGVVNAASYQNGAVSPGEIVTIFGTQLGPEQPVFFRLDEQGRLPVELAGTQVLIEGRPAPLIAVSATQVSFLVPSAASSLAALTIEVARQGQRSAPVTIPVRPAHPGIFTLSQTGTGQAAVLNEDGSVNSPGNPARRGSVISLFLTGAGLTTPPADETRPAPFEEPPRVVAPVVVRAGGVRCEIEYAGLAPGQVAGLVQVNVRLPAEMPAGAAVPLQVEVGGQPAQPGVTLAVE